MQHTSATFNKFQRLSPVRALLDPSILSKMARGNYRRELLAALFFPVALAAAEGSIAGVIVKNIYTGIISDTILNYVVGLLTTAGPIAAITSFVWAALSHGKPKVRFITGLQLIIIAQVALIAAAPKNALGLFLLVLAVLGTRACWTGIVMLRSTAWRANYPRENRASITGRFGIVQTIVLGLSGLIIGSAMDINDNAFLWLMPVAAFISILGIIAYKGIRVRGQARLLTDELAQSRTQKPSLNPQSMVRLLRADKNYAWFMACQFIFGTGNLMLTAPLVLILHERFDLAYGPSIMIVSSVPLLVMPLMILPWARMLDRFHIVTFRSIHSWVFFIQILMLFAGVVLNQLWIIYAAAVVRGIAFAGGAMAWSLGHHDFAPADKESQYMAVHVTLTGVRGIIAPLLAVTLYTWFESLSPGAGPFVFLVCATLTMLGAIGFVIMAKTMKPSAPQHEPAQTTASGVREA